MNPTAWSSINTQITVNHQMASLGASLWSTLERGLRCLVVCMDYRATILSPYLF